jgi:2-oxoglutarate ferredoxin oxidoreductase subunit beta
LDNLEHDHRSLDDYTGSKPFWCRGCGDYAILTAVQKLCYEEQIPTEKMVFVSGLGCASEFVHFIKGFGFQGVHGRALPVAQGIKLRRPDLNVFVNMGDGDCFSIGAAHWIHATRYNMDMVVIAHDNHILADSKEQASPTSLKGQTSTTTPQGAPLSPMLPLLTTLGVSNVSFVAQAPDWNPEMLYQVIRAAHLHKGFSFVRILQRCPKYTSSLFDAAIADPNKVLLLTHADGIQVSDATRRMFKNRQEHNPADINGARALAARQDVYPAGILYRNETVPVYEELRQAAVPQTPEIIRAALEKEFDKFGVVAN